MLRLNSLLAAEEHKIRVNQSLCGAIYRLEVMT
jgi:hypothetical protein